MLKTYFKHALIVVMLSSITTLAFAEDAPVYDVDNMPQQFDGQSDSGAPPVPPSQGYSEQAIVPSQSLTLEQRVARVERQMSSSAKVDQLQSEVQTLRGQIEDLTHQLQTLQTQQRTMYSDLDKRVSNQSSQQAKVSSKPISESVDTPPKVDDTDAVKTAMQPHAISKKSSSVSPAAPAKVADSQPNVAEEQQTYQVAYDLIKAKKYNDAITALQKMLQKYPSGQFAANAHYWLGELYGLTGKNEQSAAEFATIVKTFPDSPKVSDAQLKLGLIYAAQFKWPDAKSAYKKVIKNYPGTASAHLALEQLKQLKQAGH